MTQKTKQCKVCKQEKPVTEFYKSKTSRDGYGATCRTCASAVWKERYGYAYKAKRLTLARHNMFYPLAYIAYTILKKKHGEVTYDIVARYVYATKLSTEKALEILREQDEKENAVGTLVSDMEELNG